MNVEIKNTTNGTTLWNALVQRQKGCCVICEKHQLELDTLLKIDINGEEDTKALLCKDCSNALEYLSYKVTNAENALKYVKKIYDSKCRKENNLEIDVCNINKTTIVCNLENSLRPKEEVEKAV